MGNKYALLCDPAQESKSGTVPLAVSHPSLRQPMKSPNRFPAYMKDVRAVAFLWPRVRFYFAHRVFLAFLLD